MDVQSAERELADVAIRHRGQIQQALTLVRGKGLLVERALTEVLEALETVEWRRLSAEREGRPPPAA